MGSIHSTLKKCYSSFIQKCKKFNITLLPSSKVRNFQKGMFDLRVWPGVEGSERTPGKAPDRGKEQMQRLAKLAKKHRNGHIPKVKYCFLNINAFLWLRRMQASVRTTGYKVLMDICSIKGAASL